MLSFRRTLFSVSSVIKRKLSTFENHLEIKNANDKIQKFPYVWLRDHCRCPTCWNAEVHHKNANILDLPLTVKPKSITENKETGKLFIEWVDGHKTEFELNFLKTIRMINANDKVESRRKFHYWDRDAASDLRSKLEVPSQKLLTSDESLKELILHILTYGVGFVTEVDPTLDATEKVVSRVGMIRKTMFGEMFEVSLDGLQTYVDSAYQNVALYPHTDNIYYTEPAGLQIFHLLKHDGEGGETVLVDGFNVANKIRDRSPESFEMLCKYPVPAQYTDNGVLFTNMFPAIQLHPLTKEVFHIRYNMLDRDIMTTVYEEDIPKYYQAYQELTSELLAPENTWKLKLSPGTVILIDNWRILHGRTAFTGNRRLGGCYVSRDYFISTANQLGLKHY